MVEVDVTLDNGVSGYGSSPTGSSVGKYESFVMRDNDPGEYGGLSVHSAVDAVNKVIAPALIGMDVLDQEAIDRKMIDLDGTENKSRLGGNSICSTSIAVLRAAAAATGQSPYRYLCGRDIRKVPVPSFNVINGGTYGNLTLAFNEFLIVPYKADSIYEAVEIGVQVFQKLEKILTRHLGKRPEVARSYGWAAPSHDPAVALTLMQEAADVCGYADKVAFALDCASSEMYDAKTERYHLMNEQVTADTLISYAKELTERFPIVFIEDLLDENDWDNYAKAVKAIDRSILIGDDLIASNTARLQKAIEMKAAEGFVLKPNQVGTITEALETYEIAKAHNMMVIPSGRSGGVVNDIVMDISVGKEVDIQKNGAPKSGERIEKLNFLMRACDENPGCALSNLSSLVRF